MLQRLKFFLSTHSQFVGVTCAILTIMIWSGNFIAGRGLAQSIPPITLVTARCIVALLAVLPFVWPHLKQDWPIIRKHLPYYAISSFTGMACLNALAYIAAREIPALNMSIVGVTNPLFTIIFARFLYCEPVGYKRLLGIVIVMAGVLVLLCRGDFSQLAQLEFSGGDLLMLLFSVNFAVYNLLVKKAPKGVSGLSFLALIFAFSVFFCLFGTAYELGSGGVIIWSPVLVASILYLGIGASLLAYTLWNISIARIGPLRTSMFYYMMPLFSGILAVLLLGEPVLPVHLVSGAMILGGLLIATLNR